MSEITPMSLDDVSMLLDWAAAEGWNPGLDDAAAFWSADPEGFLVKRVDGRPAAAISVVNHDADFAFLGLYICLPDFRGQGHGWDVWQAGLAHAGGRTIGLDGVPAQQDNYARSGFVKAGRTTRYTGRLPAKGTGLRPLQSEDLPALLAADHRRTGMARTQYLTQWLIGAETRQTLVRGPLGAPDAMATGRRCRSGRKIGPLQARDADMALDLIGTLSDGDEVSIDIPDSSPALSDAVQQAGFVPVFETARMYRGRAPATRPGPYEAVVSLELG